MASYTYSLEEAFQLDRLRAAYDRLLEQKTDQLTGEIRLPRGWDRVSQAQFEAQLDQHLAAVRRKVLGGRYTFRPFVYVEVPKITGGTRKIAMSTIRDRLVQGVLLDLVNEAVEPRLGPRCHAYRQGKSVHSAIRQAHAATSTWAQWALESDFKSFFDNIDHDLLMREVCGLGLDSRLERLIFRYLRTPQMRKGGPPHPLPESRDVGVPQGGVLSGVLSNLYLAGFDEAMRDEGLYTIRYADDFVVLAKDKARAENARTVAETQARKCRLDLHPNKTRVCTTTDGLDFVGFRITGSYVRIRDANIAKFKARVREVIACHTRVHSTLDQQERARRRLINHANAKIKGVEIDGEPRSWIAFFRIVNDYGQIRRLNTWFWRSISNWNRSVFGSTLPYRRLRELGLASLTAEYRRVRAVLPTTRLAR